MEIVLVMTSYFVGSIMFGHLIAKHFGVLNIQQEGSGNVGARNVGRIVGKKAFVLTFLGDALKGSTVVFLAQVLEASNFWQITSLLAAIIGHLFPVFLNFRGGKGVSTFIGGFLVFASNAFVLFLCTFLVTLVLLRNTTLAGLLSIYTSPFLLLWFKSEFEVVIIMFAIVNIIIFAHQKNILERLKA